MASRLNLHEELCEKLGSRNVYYQPPSTIRMKFPAIVYFRKNIENVHANDGVYGQRDSYEITVIDEDPESEVVRAISTMSCCSYDRHFTSDNLHHDVFTLYY